MGLKQEIEEMGLHVGTDVLSAWVNKIFGSQNVDTLTCQPFSCPC
jgi:hypothetical protein